MNVIRRSARGYERKPLAMRNSAQVGMKFGRAYGRDERTAILGAEDAMNEIARVRVRHGTPSLRDSRFTKAIPLPTNKHCASGAGECDGEMCGFDLSLRFLAALWQQISTQ